MQPTQQSVPVGGAAVFSVEFECWAGTPTLTANDFQCFLDRYAAGCS